ncbi:hypothetical protein L4C36_19815 [Photobacterium japonica]|uniref:hypothetical protein n=1 Tax=Photobacterium japonica TaxID=2910235 RepID=UPI003D1244B8
MKKGLVILISALTLAGCGGGGGGDGDGDGKNLHVYLKEKSVDVVGDSMSATFAGVKFDSNGTTNENVYIGILEPNGRLLEAGDIYFTSDTGGEAVFQFHPGYKIGEGTTESEILIAVCYDQNCNRQASGSPLTVSARYSVELERLTLTDAQNRISKHAVVNDKHVDNPLITQSLAFTGSNSALLNANVDIQGDIVTHTLIDDLYYDGTQSTFTLTSDLMLPSALGAGTHTDTITVSSCYDEACDYPVQGSPITIPVSYQITTGISDPAPALAVGNAHPFNHNVVDAEYIPALDVIVMASSQPSNAAYIYDIANGTTSTFPLPTDPYDVAVDHFATQGRVAIGQAGHITVIDYDPDHPASSPTLHHTSSREANDVLVKRDLVYQTSTYDWGMNAFNTTTQTESTINNNLRKISKMAFHPSGRHMFTTTTAFSPQDIRRLTLDANRSPGNEQDSQYHGDHPMGDNFWLSPDGNQIYTSRGSIFDASISNQEVLTFTGSLPLAQYEEYGHPWDADIIAMSEYRDQLVVADDSPVGTVRILDKSSLIPLQSYPKTQVTMNEREYDEKAIAAMFTDEGHLFVIKQGGDYENKRARLIRLD